MIDAPLERVWAALRDFGGHGRWHPDVTFCQVENELDGDVVGCVRRLRVGDQAELREQLLRHSDLDHSYSYAVLDSPLPILDNVTTLGLRPVSDTGQTFLHWSAEFRSSKSRAEELSAWMGRVFESGFNGLRSYLADEAAPAPQASAATGEPALAVPGESLAARAVIVESGGGLEGMALREFGVAAPEAGQVRIRQKAVAINRLDILQCQGLEQGLDLPGTPGLEGVGEIIDVGAQVNGLYPGDRVAWLSREPGAYADICLRDALDCIHLPDGVSDLDASTLLKGLSAEILLGRVFRAGPGASIMIESVSSGFGHILCQWARSLHMVVLGTAENEEQARFARDCGCAHPIIVTDGRTLLGEVMRITNGKGVDCWVHGGRGIDLDHSLAGMARFGHLAIMGAGKDQPISLEIDGLKRRSLTVSFHDILPYLKDRLCVQRSAQNYFVKLQSGAISPVVETLPLSQAREALLQSEAGLNLGALALLPGS